MVAISLPSLRLAERMLDQATKPWALVTLDQESWAWLPKLGGGLRIRHQKELIPTVSLTTWSKHSALQRCF